MARALKYYHAVLRMEGVWTVPPAPPVEETMGILTGFFDSAPDAEI